MFEYEPVRNELVERLSDGRPRDGEPGAQLVLGRQQIARRKLAGRNFPAQRFVYLFILRQIAHKIAVLVPRATFFPPREKDYH